LDIAAGSCPERKGAARCSLSYGGQVAPRNDGKYELIPLAAFRDISADDVIECDDGSAERKNGSVPLAAIDAEPNSLARSGQILLRIQADLGCPVLFEKIFFFFQPDPNHFTDSRHPVPQRGVAQRHQRGAGCGGRGRRV
jgi:hypothetical protein